MKSIKIDVEIQRDLQKTLAQEPLIATIVKKIDQAGGKALLVGGAVRDLVLKRVTKDLDIEVHDITPEQLEDILKSEGPISLVGKSFGVLRLHHLDVDWSLPRSDSAGRKPTVAIDPFMGIKEAFRRRDLTMNAMGIDLTTYELLDPLNGLHDLKKKILRVPDPELFVQDPLRFYRVMQFVGRFNMQPDAQLQRICKQMKLVDISVERIEAEFEKLFLKSERPSLGIRWLHELGRLAEVLPELAATVGVKQDPSWHPEGDVFEHTMQTIDAAAVLEYHTDEQKLILLFAALCHDLGKVSTTALDAEGVIRSLGHEQESVVLTKMMMKRISTKKSQLDAVCKLIKYHMVPGQLVDAQAKPAAYKRLANKLAPHATLAMLAQLALADKRGRNPKKEIPLTTEFDEVKQFLAEAQEVKVLHEAEKPILRGRDLMPEVAPGEHMGELLKQAYEIQLEEGIKDIDELKKRVLG